MMLFEPFPPAPGFVKFGWLKMSKKFASNRSFVPSVILNDLLIPKSQFVNMGPGSELRPSDELQKNPPFWLTGQRTNGVVVGAASNALMTRAKSAPLKYWYVLLPFTTCSLPTIEFNTPPV